MSDQFDQMNYLLVFGNMLEEGLEVFHAIGYAEEPSDELMKSDLLEMMQQPKLYPWLYAEQWEAKVLPPGEAQEEFKRWMREVKPLVMDMSELREKTPEETLEGHDINDKGTVH